MKGGIEGGRETREGVRETKEEVREKGNLERMRQVIMEGRAF